MILVIITITTTTLRTHGIWFLPSLTKDEATSILHSKEPGVRIVVIDDHLVLVDQPRLLRLITPLPILTLISIALHLYLLVL